MFGLGSYYNAFETSSPVHSPIFEALLGSLVCVEMETSNL